MSKTDNLTYLNGFVDTTTGFALDMSAMGLEKEALDKLQASENYQNAPEEMKKIEAGAIKNPDEGRQVTHFSDRLVYAESEVFAQVEAFAEKMRTSTVLANGKPVEYVIINGIGGSALGPQLLQFAINGPYWNELSREQRGNNPRIYFIDNTDSSGIHDIKQVVDLSQTLAVTVSKSGGTQETLNNMIGLEQAYQAAGLDFAGFAAAVTMEGSKLDVYAKENNWLSVFPMAESIGGRTSETLIVGHVPAALTGIDFASFVNGAKHMDELTRSTDVDTNPAYQLASAWYAAGNGLGDRNMVMVPYSDRLVLLGKYLQQLVMESIGKELDLDGNTVHQGLTVYGNKGGTDAHAYIQQLNDGRDDFFVTFIEILKDSETINISEDLTMGDYLHAFKCGLSNALSGKGRKVIEIALPELNEAALGMIIALYERAVAVYAEYIHINAFHQPGVQAYKLASKAVNDLSSATREWIGSQSDWSGSAADAAAAIGSADQSKDVEGLLAKYAINEREFNGKKVSRTLVDGASKFSIC